VNAAAKIALAVAVLVFGSAFYLTARRRAAVAAAGGDPSLTRWYEQGVFGLAGLQ